MFDTLACKLFSFNELSHIGIDMPRILVVYQLFLRSVCLLVCWLFLLCFVCGVGSLLLLCVRVVALRGSCLVCMVFFSFAGVVWLFY